jgi:hypothetical protein
MRRFPARRARPAGLARLHAVVALASAVAGCDTGRATRLVVRYEDVPVEAVPERPRASVAGGRMVVEGTYVTGTCHWWVARGVRRDAGTVTLWVRERGGGAWFGGGCDAAAFESSFRATISGLTPGTYVVRLEDGTSRLSAG